MQRRRKLREAAKAAGAAAAEVLEDLTLHVAAPEDSG